MQVGDVVGGKYRLEAIIGEGAMGVVWRGTQLGLERSVAIKVLSAKVRDDVDTRARFVREARVAAALHHPSVVSVYDFGPDFLVMELLTGQSLRKYLESTRPTIAAAVAITLQIADALVAAHELNLVHRDLKPENIHLEGDRIRVVDFGLAFITDDTHQSLGRMTGTGILAGTPAYMSPEQVRGGAIGPACDVYALGCILYELISGHPPFRGTVHELITRHVYLAPVPLRVFAPELGIPTALDALVSQMLDKSPALRPPPKRIIEVLTTLDGAAAAEAPKPHVARLPQRETLADDDVQLPAIEISWVGAKDSDLELALATNGIAIVAKTAIVFAPGATSAELAKLVGDGRRVIADVDAVDLDAVMVHLKAGVVDVVSRPVRLEELVRKVRRVARRPS